MTEFKNHFDDILIHLETGKWNIIHFLSLSFASFMVPCLVLAGPFLSPSVGHSCKLPPLSEHEKIIEIDECSYVIEKRVEDTFLYVNQTEKCTDWNFETDVFSDTLTSEFELVCGKDYLRPTFQTAYMLGNFFGSPVIGMLSDRFGRKKLFTGGLYLAIISVSLSSFLSDFTAILFLRILTGISHSSLVQTGFILVMEVCEPKHRSLVGILFCLPWALGTMWWGILGYLIRDWRWLQRISLVPAFIIFIFLCRILDESPRWLIVRGEHENALKVLKRAAELNKRPLPPDEELSETMEIIQKSSLKNTEKQELNKGGRMNIIVSKLKNVLRQIIILYKTPEVRKRVLLMYIVFIACSTVYYGLAMNAVNFNLDPFMYMIVIGAMDIPASTVTAPIIDKFGRIPLTSFSFIVCGISIFVLGFIPNDIKWLVIAFAMTGKFFISSAYAIIYLISSEAFPTEIKLQVIGTCNFVSRTGSIVAPYITDIVGQKYSWVPSIIFGILSFIAGVSAIFIPETLNCPLAETIEQLERDSTLDKSERRYSYFKDQDEGGCKERGKVNEAIIKDEEADVERNNCVK